MEPGSGDKLAKLTLQLRETCLKKVWLTSISNCGMETYCTVISFASHHLQSFTLTQRYELAGTDKQPPLHLPDLINKCNSHSKWCTEQCVCVCVRSGIALQAPWCCTSWQMRRGTSKPSTSVNSNTTSLSQQSWQACWYIYDPSPGTISTFPAATA